MLTSESASTMWISQRLLDWLAEQIDDPIFLDPIQNPLYSKADGTTFQNNGIGLPQGAVLFPIPTNVVLDRFSFFALFMCREEDLYYVPFADDLGTARFILILSVKVSGGAAVSQHCISNANPHLRFSFSNSMWMILLSLAAMLPLFHLSSKIWWAAFRWEIWGWWNTS